MSLLIFEGHIFWLIAADTDVCVCGGGGSQAQFSKYTKFTKYKSLENKVELRIVEHKVFRTTLTCIMLSLVPKKGQVMLEMANLLCGSEVANKNGGRSSSPNGEPNGSRTRNTLFSGISNNNNNNVI